MSTIPAKIPATARAKLTTGITGFDLLTHGGLLPGRTTLLMGGAGSGKTLFALQTLVNAARQRDESGIFVAFEEPAAQLLADTAGFSWELSTLAKHKLLMFEARLSPDDVHSGDFDLCGMLAILEAKRLAMNARWIVFDGIDVLLQLLHEPLARMREIHRLRDWIDSSGLNALITAKAGTSTAQADYHDAMEFIVDCVIRVTRRLELGVPLHRLEISKYRGSDFIAGEFPIYFGPNGLEVAGPESKDIRHSAPTERVSAGFERLDTLLGGGVFRGSSTLITGVPGTAKTTLSGKFIEAACLRGERSLFLSFDEGPEPIQRNLASVGIALAPHVKSGLLRMYSVRTESIGAEEHLITLKRLMREHRPRCVVIDPLSSITKAGSLTTARAVANRLIYFIKDEHVTLMVTSINEGDDPTVEATELQVSAIADTWIHLSYMISAGERNRLLTVIKSRGTWHSNQVRELLLDEEGVHLADVYSAEGEVLMGALRWQKEREELQKSLAQRDRFETQRAQLEKAEATIRAQLLVLQQDLVAQQQQLAALAVQHDASLLSEKEHKRELDQLRHADLKLESVRKLTKSRAGGKPESS